MDSSVTRCTTYEVCIPFESKINFSLPALILHHVMLRYHRYPCQYFSHLEFTCQNAASCEGNMNTSYCVCPIDKYGDDCSKFQPLDCNMTLLQPPLNCVDSMFATNDPKAYLLEVIVFILLTNQGDRACLVFGINDVPTFSYNLQCKFQQTVNVSIDTQNANFSYFIKNSRVSVLIDLIFSLPFTWRIIGY